MRWEKKRVKFAKWVHQQKGKTLIQRVCYMRYSKAGNPIL